MFIFSNSLAYAKRVVKELENAPEDRTVNAYFIQHNDFAAATDGQGPQAEFAGELHIDVQHTGPKNDFVVEALKQKVKDFLLGLVTKHHKAIDRKLYNTSDPTSAFKAFDVTGNPSYPAIHFRAVCDEVTDAQYLIDQVHMGSSIGEAAFSVCLVHPRVSFAA